MRYACPSARLVLLLLAGSVAWTASVSGTGNGGPIPPGAPAAAAGTFTSDAVVNGSGTVAAGNAITIVLKGLQHDWSGDLVATLSYVDSQGSVIRSANIFYRIGVTSSQPGGAWASFGTSNSIGDNYTFNSDAGGNIWAVAASLGFADSIPGQTASGGSYFTSDAGGSRSNLSYVFAGLDVGAGRWRLTITDVSDHEADGSSVSNVGSLVGWEIDIQTGGGPPPRQFTVSPASGAGSSQSFTFTFSGADFAQAHIAINSSISGANGCYVLFWPSQGGLYLLSDDGAALLGPLALGSNAGLSNSQCSLTGSGATAAVSGATLTLVVPVSFNAGFDGPKNIYLAAFDTSYTRFDWVTAGTWTVAH